MPQNDNSSLIQEKAISDDTCSKIIKTEGEIKKSPLIPLLEDSEI